MCVCVCERENVHLKQQQNIFKIEGKKALHKGREPDIVVDKCD